MKKCSLIKSLLFCICLVFGGCSSQQTDDPRQEQTETNKDAEWERAESSPFEPYPELVTYTLGKMSGAENSNMPQGDTYENNAYTRYLREMLNIQNKDVFEAMSGQYDTNIEMCIASGELPDVMVVSNQEVLRRMVKLDLIEDLSNAYEQCASDRLKDMYASCGSAIESTIFDGKMMALPETNIEDGPNLLWLRKDWMDKLGLDAPKNLEDMIKIIRAFMEEDPGKNGEGNTIGLLCDVRMAGEAGYSSEYLLDIIFACYGSYPKQWIWNAEGQIVYGSVQPETKDALVKLHELYKEGIIDQNFLLRSSSNRIELICEGKCGSFFGPWWAPNNPLMEAMEANPEAVWEPYLIETDEDGKTSFHSQNPNYKFVVVRKGYEHPELVVKMASVMFDYIRYEDNDAEEFMKYLQLNVDPTARPISINVDYSDGLIQCYKRITAALDGTLSYDELPMLERSYYEYCSAYLEHPQTATKEEWAAYASRIQTCALLESGKLNEVESLFFGTTLTMDEDWWKLDELEEQTFLKIVTGAEDISYFDTFVEEWNEKSGAAITAEVRARVTADGKK